MRDLVGGPGQCLPQYTVAVVGPRGDVVGRTGGVELQRQGRI
jgi:hypothetical protein